MKEESKIYLYMRARGYSHAVATWLVKQSVLETGSFSSRAYREDKNAWGMGKVYRRPTTQVSSRNAEDGSGVNKIAKYTSVFQSHRDRVLFDDWHLEKFTEANGLTKKFVKSDLPTYLRYMQGTNFNSNQNYYPSVMRVEYDATKLRVFISVAILGVTLTLLMLIWKKYGKK